MINELEFLIDKGFAIFVAIFVLVRLEKTMKEGFKEIVDAINGQKKED